MSHAHLLRNGATSEREAQVLIELALHKALRVDQLAILTNAPPASVRKILQQHRLKGVLERAWLRTRSRRSVWYFSEEGARHMASSGLVDGHKASPPPPAVVAGQFQSHNLEVNDVGIAFVRAGRERGGELSTWVKEVRHTIVNGYGKERTIVIADALVQHQVERNGAGPLLLSAFMELDRGTVPIQRLVDQVLAYARLLAHEDACRDRYAAFQVLLVVLAGKDRVTPERRMAALTGALRADPRAVTLAPTFLALHEDVIRAGPFSTVFRSVDAPDVPVDVLGHPDPERGHEHRSAGAHSEDY